MAQEKQEIDYMEFLVYGGIALMGCSTIGAVVAVIAFVWSGKKLNAEFDREYGKKIR